MTTATTTPANPKLVEELRDALCRRPFQPFAIVMRDGKKHRVVRALQAGTNGINVGIIDNKDRMTWFKIHDVLSIEPIVSPRRGGRRGKSR
jgi:hypothetical protein